jgi:hypothetical protein
LVILKVDFEKAFDNIEHEAMMGIMRYQGLGDFCSSWMSAIFNSGTSTMLSNSVAGKTFHC